MATIITWIIGGALAWLIGVNVWDVPISELTAGMIVRNFIAICVFCGFFAAGIDHS